MKIQEKSSKKNYHSPQIEKVVLDRQISLILSSDINPPGEPGGNEWSFDENEYDPFESDLLW